MSAPAGRLDKVFTECLQHHPEGHAIYKKISAKDLKPGTCGYVDENGDWNTIAQITDEGAMNMLGWTSPVGLVTSVDPGIQRWAGPKTSQNMHGGGIQLDARVDAAGLPVGGGVSFRYEKAVGNGAIMIADGDIKHYRAAPTSKINDWMEKNAHSILKKVKDARDSGIWVVTSTYVATRRVLAVLSSQETEFSWTIEAQAAGIGKIAPGGSWWKGRQDGSWDEHEDADGVVLFFCGIQWDPHRLFRRLRRRRNKQHYLAGGEDDKLVEAIEVEFPNEEAQRGPKKFRMKLVPKKIGTVDGAQFKASYDSDDSEENHEDADDDEQDED